MNRVLSLKKALVRALSSRPELHGWIRRGYCWLGLGTRTERDFLFALSKRQRDIVFVEIGANDGKTNDPLHYFVKKYRWKGIAVEPVPEIFEKLRRTYQNDDNIIPVCAALADRNGSATFYQVEPGPGVPESCSFLGSFSRDTLLLHTHRFPEIHQHVIEQMVPTITFDTLVEQSGFKRIDVIMIDTEGYDYEVLKQIDFRRFRPILVIYEQIHLTDAEKSESKRLLESFGYKVHNSYNMNFVAVRT